MIKFQNLRQTYCLQSIFHHSNTVIWVNQFHKYESSDDRLLWPISIHCAIYIFYWSVLLLQDDTQTIRMKCVYDLIRCAIRKNCYKNDFFSAHFILYSHSRHTIWCNWIEWIICGDHDNVSIYNKQGIWILKSWFSI